MLRLASETIADTDTYTITDYDVNMTDSRSEFSEFSAAMSRKSSAPIGLGLFDLKNLINFMLSAPEEGPPRKKIKSPPAISPTGSSTSLYSGGSSVDWSKFIV